MWLVEGLALPREEPGFGLTYCYGLAGWVDVDRLLALFAIGNESASH
jgi:hypothetical protein